MKHETQKTSSSFQGPSNLGIPHLESKLIGGNFLAKCQINYFEPSRAFYF